MPLTRVSDKNQIHFRLHSISFKGLFFMARQKLLKELVDFILYVMVACLQFFLLRVSREPALKFAEILARLAERVATPPHKII